MKLDVTYEYLLVGHLSGEGRNPTDPAACFRKIAGAWASVPRAGDHVDFGHYYGQDGITMVVYTPVGVELHFHADADSWPLLAEDGFERSRDEAGWAPVGLRYTG